MVPLESSAFPPPIPILCLADLAAWYTVRIQRGISAAWIGPETDEKQCAQTRSAVQPSLQPEQWAFRCRCISSQGMQEAQFLIPNATCPVLHELPDSSPSSGCNKATRWFCGRCRHVGSLLTTKVSLSIVHAPLPIHVAFRHLQRHRAARPSQMPFSPNSPIRRRLVEAGSRPTVVVQGRLHSSSLRRSWNLRTLACLARCDVLVRRSRQDSKTSRSYDLSFPVFQVSFGEACDRTRRGDVVRSSRHIARLASFLCAHACADPVTDWMENTTGMEADNVTVSFRFRSIARPSSLAPMHVRRILTGGSGHAPHRRRRVSFDRRRRFFRVVALRARRAASHPHLTPAPVAIRMASRWPSKGREIDRPDPRERRRSRDVHVAVRIRCGTRASSGCGGGRDDEAATRGRRCARPSGVVDRRRRRLKGGTHRMDVKCSRAQVARCQERDPIRWRDRTGSCERTCWNRLRPTLRSTRLAAAPSIHPPSSPSSARRRTGTFSSSSSSNSCFHGFPCSFDVRVSSTTPWTHFCSGQPRPRRCLPGFVPSGTSRATPCRCIRPDATRKEARRLRYSSSAQGRLQR